MNRSLPPHQVLSRLEESRRNRLLLELARIHRERERMTNELKAVLARHTHINSRRCLPCGRVTMAAELVELDAARRDALDQERTIRLRLAALEARERELADSIAACTGRCRAYGALSEEERRRNQARAEAMEQRTTDDMTARRLVRGRPFTEGLP